MVRPSASTSTSPSSHSLAGGPPEGATSISLSHRVGFHETDAMGIVHHANYLKFCENARVIWLETHHQPYPVWIALDLHLAVTRVELDYRHATRFDDVLEVMTWLEWIGGASLAMGYRIACRETLVLTGRTEHAAVNGEGRVRRIPREYRTRLAELTLPRPDLPRT